MPWTFIRPRDGSVLAGRPLLDIGTGDGQTVVSLVDERSRVFGVDRTAEVLAVARRLGLRVAGAEAASLPFPDETFEVVLAADLFHHLDDGVVGAGVAEAARVLRPDGRLVAWWYSEHGVKAPDAPRFPRTSDAVAEVVSAAGLRPVALDLVAILEPSPPTVGIVATK